MKTILTAGLVLATAFLMAPGATACDVEVPAGGTYTCMDARYGSSNCEADSGSGYTATYAYTNAPGVAHVNAGTWESCYRTSSHHRDASGTNAVVYLYPGGFHYIAGGTYESTGSYERCDAYVQQNLVSPTFFRIACP